MLQLSLNFLERQIDHLKPPRARQPQARESLAWKHGITVHLVRHPRARRYLLRLQSDGAARLVLPRRGSRSEAVRFLERSEAWLLKRLAQWQSRSDARQPWVDGTRFPFRGEEVALRAETIGNSMRLSFGDQVIPLSCALPDYRKAVCGHLRRLAERELPVRTRELASIHGIAVHRISVRAQKTRWGSCSARGTLSLNWRVIQAPPHVMDYLILHELMHRREMNHSARFWKLVAAACPGYQAAERWLKNFRLDETG